MAGHLNQGNTAAVSHMCRALAHLIDHVIPHVPLRQWVLRCRSRCGADERQRLRLRLRLEHLCPYITRPALAHE